MKEKATRQIQGVLLLVGVIVTFTGFGVHFLIPGICRSGFAVTVDAMDTTLESIHLSTGPSVYSFSIEILGLDPQQPSEVYIYLLDEVQYALYESGSAIGSVESLLEITGDSRGSYETTSSADFSVYIVVINNGTELKTLSYYYVFIPSTYLSSAVVGFAGLFLLLLYLGWTLNGWRRYFLAGLGVNLAFFLIRIFTLTTYSLGLPDIFLQVLQVELYNDYQFFYLSWVPTLWEGAWAYSSALPVYLYPPLWIYTVALFGSVPAWLPGAILFSFNIATGIIVYKIAMVLSNRNSQSIFAMMIYLLNPITVGYGSFSWLNPTPFVFFTILSFYLALTEKPEFSVLTLSVATLYKQFGVIFFPILALFLIRKKVGNTIQQGLTKFFKYTIIYGFVLLLVSLPFLLFSPQEFYNQVISMGFGSYSRLTVFTPDLSMPVHFGSFFLWLGGSSWFTDILAWFTSNFVFLALCGIVVYSSYATSKRITDTSDGSDFDIKDLFMKAILWSFVAVLCLQVFFPRGVYKFYLLALMPFASLLFDYRNLTLSQDTDFHLQKHHLFIPLFALVVFLCYRFIYLWLLVAWAWFYLIRSGELTRILNGIRGFYSKGKGTYEYSSEAMETWEQIYSE